MGQCRSPSPVPRPVLMLRAHAVLSRRGGERAIGNANSGGSIALNRQTIDQQCRTVGSCKQMILGLSAFGRELVEWRPASIEVLTNCMRTQKILATITGCWLSLWHDIHRAFAGPAPKN